ncbi:hypothetical protein [Streptomyces indicus]|uniref:hypothetical protein n=1 Tax=Streptomyces indicus TaxID=417292 RepID=UPI000B8879BF|nr:hypothetical protein [Streptomyces indicus]
MSIAEKETLPPAGQMALLFGVGAFLLAVGLWFLVNRNRPHKILQIDTLQGFSARGEGATKILARLIGVVLAIGGAGALLGGVVVVFRTY